MLRTIVARLTVGALVLLQAPVHAQAGDSPSPASLERIRAALEKPAPILWLPAVSAATPTFRIEIRQAPSMLRPVEEESFDPTFGLPSVGELLMGGVAKIQSAAVHYKRGRAKRRVQREVDE